MSFQKLAEELQALQSASAESTPANGAGAGGTAAVGTETQMVKSFSFTLEDGTVVDAVDGADLVKSLVERFDTQAATHATENADLVKSLTAMTALIKAQGEQIARLSGTGAGRRATVAMPANAGAGNGTSEPLKVTPAIAHEVMAKAHAAQALGRISGVDVATADGYFGKGMLPPLELLQRING